MLYYFGPVADPDGALRRYLDQRDDLHAGRKPREEPTGLTTKELANKFLAAKAALRDSGELTARSWQDYKDSAELAIRHFGAARLVDDLSPEDFASLRLKMTKKWSATTVGNVIQRIRVIFKFADDEGLLTHRVRYGQSFKRPSRKVIRLDRARKGLKLFSSEEVRRLIGEASVHLRAMILLGINAGFGPADCGTLPVTALDLNAGSLNFPRPKTGISRRASLWPETVQAIRDSLNERPDPTSPEHAERVFITKYGGPWFKDSTDHTVTKEFAKLLRRLHIIGRAGLGFYTLRHTYRTVADESRDQPAVDFTMGHEVAHMSSVYRETISDERLHAVAEHVRRWLFFGPHFDAA
jgi:integrase